MLIQLNYKLSPELLSYECGCFLVQVDDGWWIGDCNGRRGLFPANYVEEI